MKSWRLTRTAERSLAEIAGYTRRQFGIEQALKYRDALIARINRLAAGEPPHARDCALLLGSSSTATGLSYFREGGHYIIMRETPEMLQVIEFLHERCHLQAHVERLARTVNRQD